MNAFLLTVLALGGANGTAMHAGPGEVMSAECDARGGVGHCGHWGHGGLLGHGHKLHGSCLGPMPQTCYDPAYGCYPGTRHMNRYPAFHGVYYRRPYNYRNVFDYPWHADLHEPTSHFSYHVSGDTGAGEQRPEVIPQPPIPSAALPLHRQIEQATAGAAATRAPKGLSTLRR